MIAESPATNYVIGGTREAAESFVRRHLKDPSQAKILTARQVARHYGLRGVRLKPADTIDTSALYLAHVNDMHKTLKEIAGIEAKRDR